MIDPIDTSLLPPDVRKAGPAAQQLYAGALAFEQQLTEQLAQSLADSAQARRRVGRRGLRRRRRPRCTSRCCPDAMSQGVTAAGGLGLARVLYEQLRRQRTA